MIEYSLYGKIIRSINVEICLFDLLENPFSFHNISRTFVVLWDEYWQ
jgi:hypothetical protein